MSGIGTDDFANDSLLSLPFFHEHLFLISAKAGLPKFSDNLSLKMFRVTTNSRLEEMMSDKKPWPKFLLLFFFFCVVHVVFIVLMYYILVLNKNVVHPHKEDGKV